MKELYIAPEVELIRFAPVEKLASEDTIPADWLTSVDVEIPGDGNVATEGERDP